VPKLQQQDQAIWWDTMVKMQKLLRKASLSLFNGGKIDKETMHNYFMSGECPGLLFPYKYFRLHADTENLLASLLLRAIF
jgi:hypothetical protein